MVEVKQGSADELIKYLSHHRRKGIYVLLIVDELDTGCESSSSDEKVIRTINDVAFQDGIPTLPKRGLKQPVTSSLIRGQ